MIKSEEELSPGCENSKENGNREHSNKDVNILYTCSDVKLYYINLDGTVTTTPDKETLWILEIKDENTENDIIYLQVGDWIYPLFPNVSPSYQASFNAFIFPDVESPEKSISVVVPPEEFESFSQILEGILKIVETEKPILKRAARRTADYPTTISENLISGSRYLSGGLLKGAGFASQMISYVTPKLMEKMTPEQPKQVPQSVIKGAETAKLVTGSVATVTGYVANKVGEVTVALGRYLAPHIEKQGTHLLCSTGMEEKVAAERVAGALQIAGGAMEGFGNIYEGLRQSAGILGSSLASNTVQIVQHKYGEPVGQITGHAFDSVGSIMETSSNIKILTPKGLIKTSVKETGKAVATKHIPQPGTSISSSQPH